MIVTANDGFEDTQTIRIGDTALMTLHLVDEWQPDPDSFFQSCVPEHVPNALQPGKSQNRWPWIRRATTCSRGVRRFGI